MAWCAPPLVACALTVHRLDALSLWPSPAFSASRARSDRLLPQGWGGRHGRCCGRDGDAPGIVMPLEGFRQRCAFAYIVICVSEYARMSIFICVYFACRTLGHRRMRRKFGGPRQCTSGAKIQIQI